MSDAPAVFLDRDGVVNEVVYRDGKPGSPRSEAELHIPVGVPAAIDRLRRAGCRVFVVTNQPDVARGLLAAAQLEGMMRGLRERVDVDEVRVCPHDDEDRCECRKPKPGMILDLAERWSVDLDRAYLVGDGWKDMEAGRAAGCRTVLIQREYNESASADVRVSGLDEAVDLILSERLDGS